MTEYSTVSVLYNRVYQMAKQLNFENVFSSKIQGIVECNTVHMIAIG